MLKRITSILLRLPGVLLAIALLYWIIEKMGAMPLEALKSANPWLLLAAFAVIGSSHIIGGYRLGRLLAVQGIAFGILAMFKLTLLGDLFSKLIPGAVSGDILKIACITRQYPKHGAEAIMASLIDRIAGVSGLFIVASAVCAGFWLAMPHQVLNAHHGALALVFILVFCVGLGVTLVLPAIVCNRVLMFFRVFQWLAAVGRRWLPHAVVSFVERLCAASNSYCGHKRTLVVALALSMLIHFNLSIGLFLIGRAVGEQEFSLGAYLLGALLGNTITLIPATPGGAGLRDTTTALVFSLLGYASTPQNGSIPIIYTLMTLAWGAIGIWPVLTLRANNKLTA